MRPEEYLAGDPAASAAYQRVRSILDGLGPYQVRASKSQIAFRRRRGFAYLWIPGRYLARPRAEVVLSVALARHDPSPRFTEVAHPAPRVWMHHLEVRAPEDLDAEVEGWLRESADLAV